MIPENANFLPLERGASVYIIADAKQARPIINLLPIGELSGRQVVQMLERTDFFAAALFPRENRRRYHLSAWGDYPSFQAGVAFGSISAWQKKHSAAGSSYWYSQADGLSVALRRRQALVVVSTDGPCDPVTYPGAEIPAGFNEFRRGSPFSCWMENPAPVIYRTFNSAGIPIRFPVQQLFLNLFREGEDQYEAVIRLQFENSSHARGIAAILSLAANFTADDSSLIIASIFLANPPVLNGNYIDIRTAVLNEEEIVQLLDLFPFF